MELKVWVEGIQRVICGVTDATTCQDVVIALAHATGKTGRFTLVERWRGSERLLAPAEPPLRVLHKWGEYASDVQFILRHSEKDQRKSSGSGRSGGRGAGSSSGTSLDQGSKRSEKFLHNFTPHQQQRRMSGSSIRKSLTFSGAHTFFPPLKSGSTSAHVKSASGGVPTVNTRSSKTENSSLESLGDDHNSYCSSQSSSSPYASLEKRRGHGHIGEGWLPNRDTAAGTGSLELGSDGSGSAIPQQRPSPRRSPRPQGLSGIVSGSPSRDRQISTPLSSPLSKQAPHSQKYIQQKQTIVPNISTPHKDAKDKKDLLKQSSNNNNIATDSKEMLNRESPLKLSPRVEMLGYQLPKDVSNFKKHNGTLAKPDDGTDKASSPKKDDLMRLVRLQLERLGVQESQIKILDSEIQYWEGHEKEIDNQYKTVREETTRLQETEQSLQECLQELDLVSWADKLGIEQQQEKMLRSELTLIRSQIQNAESELLAAKSKLTGVTGELEDERRSAITKDQENKELEIKTLHEIADLQKQINRRLLQHEEQARSLEHLTKEVKSLESAILEKKTQIADWEKELRAVNMTFFVQTPTVDWLQLPATETSNMQTGRLSPSRPGSSRKMLHNPQLLKETVATSKNPHGMWV